MEGPPADDCCSICRGRFKLPCQSNCSHWFCGNCILTTWQHGPSFQACKCPLCRRQITLLVPGEAWARDRHDPDASDLMATLQRYNRLFGDRSDGILQRMRDLPFLLRRLMREMMDPQRTLPLVIRARIYIAMIMSGAYIISPVDLLPEAILGVVGLLDDLLIALICFLHVAAIYRSVLYYRHGGS